MMRNFFFEASVFLFLFYFFDFYFYLFVYFFFRTCLCVHILLFFKNAGPLWRNWLDAPDLKFGPYGGVGSSPILGKWDFI